MNLYRDAQQHSQHDSLEQCIKAAQRDANENGQATYRVRIDGGNYVEFECRPQNLQGRARIGFRTMPIIMGDSLVRRVAASEVLTFSEVPILIGRTSGTISENYPDDVNISSDPNVIFADRFETYASASELTSSGNYDGLFETANVSIVTNEFFEGAQGLQLRVPSGGSNYNALVKSVSDRDELFFRAYTKYQPGYQGISSAHDNLRTSGRYAGPGVRPDGTDFFLVSIEATKARGAAEPGEIAAYVYHPEMDDVFGAYWFPDGGTTNDGGKGPGYFGGGFVPRSSYIPALDTWICYEVRVRMNTPGLRDGLVSVWADGILIAEWTNLRFRDVGTVQIDEVQFEHGGQGSTQQNDKWFDNLVLASAYIGEMVPSTGNTINAASASQIDVETAIAQAVAGDTVVVPSGTGNWADLTISKAITVRGAGPGSSDTVINGGGGSAVIINGPATGFLKFEGFRFVGGGSSANANHMYVNPSPGTENIRITNCYFAEPQSTGWGCYFDGTGIADTGYLVDNCEFVNNYIFVAAGDGQSGFDAWKRPANLGTRNFVYIEDCQFNNTNIWGGAGASTYAVDCYQGGRYVVRYCQLNGQYLGTHDVARQGTYRASGRAWEIYENDFGAALNGDGTFSVLDLNCGTGVVFNNTFAGPHTNDITFFDYRTNDPRGQGTCNGTNEEDENSPGESGWLCQFQIGSAYQGVPASLPLLDTETPKVGTSFNEPVHWGPWGQYAVSDPVYLWNNTRGGSPVIGADRGGGGHIQEGRDVINGTQKPGYTQYTYPHPLRSI